ncbi:hypothetical protein EON65_25380, partial [archaeon]
MISLTHCDCLWHLKLYHVKSGKYLQILPNKLAKDERDNVRIGLDKSGDAYSWVQICPRFKIDREGDRILSNAEVYLRVAERGAEYIHVAMKDPPLGSMKEINCSLETTSWKLSIYQSSLDTLDRDILLSSQLIYIHDPETKCYLTVEQDPANVMDESVDSGDGQQQAEDRYAPEMYPPKIVLSPTTQSHIDTNYLWVIECNSQYHGGPFKWKTDMVKFKHFNSNRYLMLEIFVDYGEDGNLIKHHYLTCSENRDDPGTSFSVNEVNSVAKYLRNGKAVQIGHGGAWVERGEVLADSMFNFHVVTTKEKGSALSLVMKRYSKPIRSGDADAGDHYIDPRKRLDEPLDLHVGISIRNYLRSYYDMTVVSSNSELNTIWPTASRTDIETFKVVVEKIITFVMGHRLGTLKEEAANLDPPDQKIISARQLLLREQGSVELLLMFLHKLLPIIELAETRKTKLNTDKSFLYRMTQMVLHECFSVLLQTLRENPANQMYAADFMPLFLANLGSQPLAVDCVTEMLSKNLELQETKIGTREIQIFVEKLKASELNTMYLQLLQACCSCQGDGVDGNQCKVANMLFENTSNVIMVVNADYSHCANVEWNDKNSLYFPKNNECNVRGEGLLTRGLPFLSLEWMTSEEDNTNYIASVEELFESGAFLQRQDEFNLNLSFRSSMMSTAMSAKMRNMAAAQKKEIARYFVAELFLSAEMCLDRNYVAMLKLDDLFPFDILVTMVKLNVASVLKAAAVRLLMCLHIDRDPQASTKIPCLTRSWNEVRKNNEPQLPFVEPQRQYTFGVVQQIVSDHIKTMSEAKWDDLSKHILKMLKVLLLFNFYGTNERMKDVIEPLVNALDRRGINLDYSVAGSLSKVNSFALPAPSTGGKSSRNSPLIEELLEEDDAKHLIDGDFSDVDDNTSMSSMARLRKSVKGNYTVNFYEKILQYLESSLGNIIFLALLLLAVGLDVYQIVSGDTYWDFGILSIVELCILAGFALEVLVRFYCKWVLDNT